MFVPSPGLLLSVILGVDTHLDTHVGAVISDTGRLLGTLSAATDTTGYLDLVTWANSFGQLCRAGVEGTLHESRWAQREREPASPSGKAGAEGSRSRTYQGMSDTPHWV